MPTGRALQQVPRRVPEPGGVSKSGRSGGAERTVAARYNQERPHSPRAGREEVGCSAFNPSIPYRNPDTFQGTSKGGQANFDRLKGERQIIPELPQIPARGGRTMTHYLVLAHQTATSAELLKRVSELAVPPPIITILVPATPVVHLLTWAKGETKGIAWQRAEEARERFEASGLNVAQAKVGDSSPILAIGDELRAHPGEYGAAVLSTLPPGLSRWLRLDVRHVAERKFGLPVIHVVVQRQV